MPVAAGGQAGAALGDVQAGGYAVWSRTVRQAAWTATWPDMNVSPTTPRQTTYLRGKAKVALSSEGRE